MNEEALNHYLSAQEVGELLIQLDTDLIESCLKVEEAKHKLDIITAEVISELEATNISKTALKESVPKDMRVVNARAELNALSIKKKAYELTRERYIMKHSLERKAMNMIESEVRRLGG